MSVSDLNTEIQHHNFIGNFHYQVNIVLYNEDRDPELPYFIYGVYKTFCLRDIQPGRRFVQQGGEDPREVGSLCFLSGDHVQSRTKAPDL